MLLSEMPDIMLNSHYENLRLALIAYVNDTPRNEWNVDEYMRLKDAFKATLAEINRRSEQLYNTG